MQKIKDNASNPTRSTTEKTDGRATDKMGMGCTGEATKGAAGIQEHMDVIASCGSKIGVVDRIEGEAIKLTKKDSPDGQHHFIPAAWVDHVDSHVHLKRNSAETKQDWKADAAGCGCG